MTIPTPAIQGDGAGVVRRFFRLGIDPSATNEQRRLLAFHRACVAALIPLPAVFIPFEPLAGPQRNPVNWMMVATYSLALWLTLRGHHTVSKVLFNYGSIAFLALLSAMAPQLSMHGYLLAPLVYAAAVYRDQERWLRWGAVLLCISSFSWFEWQPGWTPFAAPIPLPPDAVLWLKPMVAVSLVLTVAVIATFMAFAVRHTERHLEAEHAKSERLLLNILPGPIAERLKASPGTIADGLPQVTVLFSDIVGFTPMSEKLTPKELVGVLNELFTGFDRIAAAHGLEKIKTIGDAYMVAGGLPLPCPRHAHAVADFALAARTFALAFGAAHEPPLGIRIGVHSGPVVAGVIGESKFAYDVWGDTVNTASRMESSGLPGRIQCSEASHALLADDYEFEARGTITVKGKGEMQTFFLERKRPGP